MIVSKNFDLILKDGTTKTVTLSEVLTAYGADIMDSERQKDFPLQLWVLADESITADVTIDLKSGSTPATVASFVIPKEEAVKPEGVTIPVPGHLLEETVGATTAASNVYVTLIPCLG